MNTDYTARDTEEQDNLRALFIGRGKCCKSKACPVCCAGLTHKIRGWEKGRTITSTGESVNAYQCNNCGFIKTWKMTTETKRAKPTKAQTKTIERIREFFSRHAVIAKFEITGTEYGSFWVSVETEGNVYAREGGYFIIGNRGKVECKTSYALFTKPDHYTAMVA